MIPLSVSLAFILYSCPLTQLLLALSRTTALIKFSERKAASKARLFCHGARNEPIATQRRKRIPTRPRQPGRLSSLNIQTWSQDHCTHSAVTIGFLSEPPTSLSSRTHLPIFHPMFTPAHTSPLFLSSLLSLRGPGALAKKLQKKCQKNTDLPNSLGKPLGENPLPHLGVRCLVSDAR